MSYKALYRKYRPQTFEELIGQDHIARTLNNSMIQDKIGHAYIFSGPRGTGKTSTAKLLAKAINCEDTSSHHICNVCSSCVAITQNNHPDVIEIDAASNNGVDEVRDLIDKVKYAPLKGKKKVYIIDEVHMMSTGAFNALLKTLEEPPDHVMFILATTELHKVLPTILSRCQKFEFKKVYEKNLESRLMQILTEEQIKYEPEAIKAICSLADGGVRDAISILDQVITYSNEIIKLSDVNEIFGLASTQLKIDLIQSLNNNDNEMIIDRLDHIQDLGVDIKRLTQDLVDIYKDLIVFKQTKNESLINNALKEVIVSLAAYTSIEDCFKNIEILLNTINDYRIISNPKIYFEVALLKIINENLKKEGIQEEVVLVKPKQVKTHQETIVQPQVESQVPVQVEEVVQNQSIEHTPVQETIVKPIEQDQDNQQSEVDQTYVRPSNEMAYSEQDYLNLLVQASKEDLQFVKSRWMMVQRYLSNSLTAKTAAFIVDGEVVAASGQGVIIVFDHMPNANNVNNIYNNHAITKLMLEIYGKEIYVMALTKDAWIDTRNKYVQLRQFRNLPKAYPINQNIPRIEEKKEEKPKSETFKLAKDLFKENLEIKRRNNDEY